MDAVWGVYSVVLLLCSVRAQEPADNSVYGEEDEECPVTEEEDGIACKSHGECEALGSRCCGPAGHKVCTRTKHKVVTEEEHTPFLGLIPRQCPRHPVPEPLPIRNCSEDRDCWPRLCCPDTAGDRSFCRTPAPVWDRLRLPLRIVTPMRNMLAYMQCTPPPPAIYDLFPKQCRSTLDCFPNLCCQEQDRRVCRPPKKSILALLSTLGQRQRRLDWFG
ncbi:uncharacterized protein LOC128982925 [Macrosteles quadrilineatus]|uniref:uncharacterized protein LOC128982925 n=1 Tax=Macrosteles quadrilineatus TaxID=74068 RepID=UPI0023E0DA13|nr:uncharacterized protein LOC128982925 [Macrosteles quadrilineatus]